MKQRRIRLQGGERHIIGYYIEGMMGKEGPMSFSMTDIFVFQYD